MYRGDIFKVQATTKPPGISLGEMLFVQAIAVCAEAAPPSSLVGSVVCAVAASSPSSIDFRFLDDRDDFRLVTSPTASSSLIKFAINFNASFLLM